MRPSTLARATLAALLLAACGGPPADPAPVRAVDVTTDPRLASLLAPCSKAYHYDRDTGDALGILLDKLQNGSAESLRRAKAELVALGAPAVPEVERLLERHFTGQFGSAHVQNAIEVLGQIHDPAAHASLIEGLDHPRDAVRLATLQALSQGAALPGDFDRLLVHVQGERENMRQAAALALYQADPDRARGVYLDWFDEGRYPDLWPFVAFKLLERDPAPIARRCLELYARMDPQVGLILAAGALGTGDPGPRALLDEYLRMDQTAPRLAAVSALIGIGQVAELVDLAGGDPEPTIRAALLEELGGLPLGAAPGDERVVAELRRGLDDGSPGVRAVALGALLDRRDPEAQARVLDQLDDGRETLQELAGVLPTHLVEGDPFIDRLVERLIRLDESQAHRPVDARQAQLQILGLCPSVAASRYLRDLGLATTEPVLGLRSHRWCLLQASNTGQPGRRWLMEALATEQDPVRRLDLIWAISSQPDELSRAWLLDFVQGDTDPYEVLFAADRLVRIGPTATVAPVLKRVTLRVEQADVRSALQCLLWEAY